MSAKPIIRTRAEGTQETIKLKVSQIECAQKLARQFNIVSESNTHTWRAAIRAALDGRFTLTVKPAPVGPALPSKVAAARACAGDRDSLDDL